MLQNNHYCFGKKVFVAGGSGLLGHALIRMLMDVGANVVGSFYSRNPPDGIANVCKRYDFTRYADCLSAVEGYDYVIVCAVQASGIKGVDESPTMMLRDNLSIHANLFEACAEKGVKKVVWVSSSTVYQEAFHPIGESELDLNLPPYESYLGIGWVYRYIEALALCYYKKRNLPVGVIRTSNIYGPYDRFDSQRSHVIPALIRRAIAKDQPFEVWGHSNTTRDFIYVDDLAAGVLLVLEHYCMAEPINMSSGKAVTIRELVDTILLLTDHKADPIYDCSKPTAVPYRVLDNTKSNTLLGFGALTSLESGIRQTIEWYQSQNYRE